MDNNRLPHASDYEYKKGVKQSNLRQNYSGNYSYSYNDYKQGEEPPMRSARSAKQVKKRPSQGAAQRERERRKAAERAAREKEVRKEKQKRDRLLQKEKERKLRIKKRKKRVRKAKMLFRAFVILLRNILIVMSILAAIAGTLYLIYDKVFTIKEIKYSGNKWVSDETMTSYIFKGQSKPNLIRFYLSDKFKDKKSIPYVETYEVHCDWPNKLVINVYEKDVIGCIRKDNLYYYIDKYGILLDVTNTKKEDVMIIQGVSVTDYEINKSMGATESILKDIFEIKKQLDKYNLSFEELNFDYKSEYVLRKGGLYISLGKGEYLVEKLFELSQVYYELPGTGTLHLENCSGQKKNLYFTAD
ncbi:MAG: hypothetical protein K6F17_01170 [Lachnospiraceae bacterium]|nr:hypothetical protein [Lachnospiraceae bacterium]